MRWMLFGSIVLVASAAWGQAYQVGDRVVAIRKAPVKSSYDANDAVDESFPGLSFTVAEVKGSWLLVSNGKPGWLDQSTVIPFEQASDYFAAAVRREPTNSEFVYAKGVVALEKGDLELAIDELTQLIRKDAKSAAYFNVRGMAWTEKQKYDQAIADFDDALRLDPASARAYNNRGDCYAKKGDFNRAIADFNDAIRLDPKFLLSFGNRGQALVSKGEYDQALADFSAALRLDPRSATAYNGRGNVEAAKGEFERAIANFNRARQLDPKDKGPLANLTWLHATCRDAHFRNGAKAVELGKQAWDAPKGHDAVDAENLAAAYAEAGNFAEALRWQAKAGELYTPAMLAASPARKTFLALYQAGKPYREEAKPAAAPIATPIYKTGDRVVAIRQAPIKSRSTASDTVDQTFAGLVLTVGEVNGKWMRVSNSKPGWLEQGNVIPLAEADAYFTAGLTRDPAKNDQRYGRALVRKERGDLDGALTDLNEFLRLDPGSAICFNARGLVFEAKHEYEKAIADYREAVRLDSKYRRPLGNLAWLYATCADVKLRDGEKAIELGKKLCEMSNRQDAADLGTLAAAYAQAAKFEEAVGWQTKAAARYTPAQQAEWGYLLDLYKAGKPFQDIEPKR